MSEHDPKVTLEQVIEFIAEAREYVQGQTLDTLMESSAKSWERGA